MITRVPVATAISVLPKNIDVCIFENQQVSSITFILFGYPVTIIWCPIHCCYFERRTYSSFLLSLMKCTGLK